jgi:acid phosphatase (class A)
MKKGFSVLWIARFLCVFTVSMAISGCAGMKTTAPAKEETKIQVMEKEKAASYHTRGFRAGYLAEEAVPDSAALLTPPPEEGTAAMAYDEEVAKQYLQLKNTDSWELAAKDADLSFPEAFAPFSCVLGLPITETHTPKLYALLRRTTLDASNATRGAKMKYNRARPFLVNNEPICTPEHQGALMNNGSYPSGHTAIGWTWALILAELSPDQADALMARARQFGESRMVCNVHWQSDVNGGQFMAAAAVARLHGEPTFRADLEIARAEVANARAKGLQPACGCE